MVKKIEFTIVELVWQAIPHVQELLVLENVNSYQNRRESYSISPSMEKLSFMTPIAFFNLHIQSFLKDFIFCNFHRILDLLVFNELWP